MRLRAAAFVERLRSSLFFVPMIAVVVAALLGFAGLALDRRIDTSSADLPLGLTSTVDSARALLSVIAGATISFAGIAFSVSLLIIQLASSQYSPRVVHTLFRDPFNKRVMALVVGTFTYCVVVLRSVRSALDEGGAAVIPNVSVAFAVLLGVATILAIVAFINHSAHTMDVSEILQRIRSETVALIRAEWTDPTERSMERPPAASEDAFVVRFDRTGWVQQIDVKAILDCLPDATTAHVDCYAGRYAIERTRLCSLSPGPEHPDDVIDAIRAAVAVGQTRTMQQDVSYGLRQLVDVGVKALSPGINDPTTAQDAIFHTAAVLSEMLCHDPPEQVTHRGSATVVLTQQPTMDQLVQLAFEETRRAATAQPTVCIYLLESIEMLVESLRACGLEARTAELLRQARLITAGCISDDSQLPDDVAGIRFAYEKRFGSAPSCHSV